MNEIAVGDCIRASHSNGVLVITGSVDEILEDGYKISDFSVTGPEWTFERVPEDYPEVREGEFAAEYARRRGWEVGTYLVGSPIVGASSNVIDSERTILITSIADQLVLARRVMTDGSVSAEETYQFTGRKWQVTTEVPELVDPVPEEPQAPVEEEVTNE